MIPNIISTVPESIGHLELAVRDAQGPLPTRGVLRSTANAKKALVRTAIFHAVSDGIARGHSRSRLGSVELPFHFLDFARFSPRCSG